MIIGKLNPKSNQRCVVYDIYDISPTIQAAAGTGGGQMPYIMEIKEMNKEDLILIGGMQEHQTIKTNGVCTCLTSSMGTGGGYIPMIVEKQIVAMRGRNPDNPKCREKAIYLEQILEPQKDNIANCITTVEKDNLVMETEQIRIKQATKEGSIPYEIGGVFDGGFPSSKTRRGRVIDNGNVCPTITAQNQELYRIEICESDMPGALILYMPATDTYYQVRIRKLTPRECLKLMNVDEKYLNRMLDVECNTNLYKAAGNSIVVNCLTAILGQLYEGKEEIYKQI